MASKQQLALNLTNLAQLDGGKIPLQFDQELAHVVKDIQDRPLDKRPRKVSISFDLTPHLSNSDGTVDLESVHVTADITSSVPKRRSKIYVMAPKHDGRLGFHPDLPDDPNGEGLYDDAPPPRKDQLPPLPPGGE